MQVSSCSLYAAVCTALLEVEPIAYLQLCSFETTASIVSYQYPGSDLARVLNTESSSETSAYWKELHSPITYFNPIPIASMIFGRKKTAAAVTHSSGDRPGTRGFWLSKTLYSLPPAGTESSNETVA